MLSLAGVPALAATFAAREQADREAFPAASVRDLVAAGGLTAPLPVADGGAGWSCRESTEAVLAMAARSPSIALLWSMPLGFAGIYGSAIEAPAAFAGDWARNRGDVLDRIRAGQWVAACNSEKGAGGSLANTQTTATLRDGTFYLAGEKILASAGAHADLFFSAARVGEGVIPGSEGFELFLIETRAPGVDIRQDWDGFGMRSTESQSVVYRDAPALGFVGFPNFLGLVQPTTYWLCLFAAIPLGCARAMLELLGTPAPASPALRLRLSEALMRYESLEGYLFETAAHWRPGGGAVYGRRVTRTKTWVSQEAVRLCADLFALGGGRHYTASSPAGLLLRDAFAGTALRPPLALGLELQVNDFDEIAFLEAGGWRG